MRFSGLIYFYGRRLRTRPAQELLAGVGIAIGVALVFAVQIANSSITDSSSAIVRGIAGKATLQLRSRDSNGFDEKVLNRVQRLPGVTGAASILDETAALVGRDGRRVSVDLASAAPSLLAFDGGITRSISLHDLTTPGVILPKATAHALGISFASLDSPGTVPHVTLEIRGHARSVVVVAILGREQIGDLSGAMAAIAPLWFVQKITGLHRRATRVLVKTEPGAAAMVRRELTSVAAGRLTVAAADEDVALLKHAVAPNTEATGFFALVSGIVGLLLAFNAMLLTVPERRRIVADLRIQGVRPWQLAKMLMFQALCLGVMASIVGLLAGDVLARTIFHTTPSYLAAAFPLGTETVIGLRPLLISFAGGVLATCVAGAPPLFDLRRRRAVDAVYFEEGEPGQALGGRAQMRLFLAGVAVVAMTSGLLVFWSSAVVIATIGLAVGTLLAIPFWFQFVLKLAERIAGRTPRLNMLTVAVRALRATTVRSLALAGTGAIAVFGCVVAEDSHYDLLHGLYRDYSEYVSTADLWAINSNDDLATINFPTGNIPRRIAEVPGVRSVRVYQGGFLDLDGRRVWLLARAPSTPGPIPSSQIEEGNIALATTRLREGGWITVSRQLAEQHHLHVGGRLVLPTPTGSATYRLAATTTNLGWSSGAIILNSVDYRRAWASTDATAFEIDAAPGASIPALQAAVQAMLGPGSALKVQTSDERATQADGLARQGLSRMSQISLLLMIAAALAMAAAMSAGIWQRRSTLASLRIHSYSPAQLRSVLAFESVLVLGTGGFVGAVAGIYGHFLGDRFLRLTTGFPAPFAIEGIHTTQTILLIVIGALMALVVPGYAASRVSPQLALQR
ncbi:MAG TPA: ABC transporter permease [Solirubrobacteraceae bacterium]|nr:ABC transporter permease [Solirubrobacteraceae bacterium]